MATWYELISQYGYMAIFILLTLGIVGIPLPDEVLLTYLGYVTSIGKIHFTLTLASAFAGAVCGISISYLLGIKLGEPFLRKYGSKFFIKEKAIFRTNTLFNKYGSLMLFICYFIPGVRHVAAYLAGITRFPFKRFATFAYTGAFVWVITFLVLGNRLGSNWNVIFSYVHEYTWFFIILLLLLGMLFIIYWIWKRRNK